MSTDCSKPVFPTQFRSNGSHEWNAAQTGMTLRDWFAGQALIGLVTANEDIANDGQMQKALDVAEAAYLYADEMLKAREQ